MNSRPGSSAAPQQQPQQQQPRQQKPQVRRADSSSGPASNRHIGIRMERQQPAKHRSRSHSPEDEQVCRICYQGCLRGDHLHSLCRCTGSVGLMHVACLKAWLQNVKAEHCDACELCKGLYPSWVLPERCKRARRIRLEIQDLEKQRVRQRREIQQQQLLHEMGQMRLETKLSEIRRRELETLRKLSELMESRQKL